jgi:hypothetical protein
MNFVSLFAPLLAISVLIERILEAVFSVVEGVAITATWKAANAEQYSRAKQIISIVAGILIGMFLSNSLGVALFAQFGLQGIDVTADRSVTGAIAGAAAPYSHQIIELLFNLQKLFETKKEEIATGVPVVAAAAREVNP